MHILKATIIKDIKILLRDRVGLLMMFFMPILMVMVITSVQNSTFELVNNNKITLVICNLDHGPLGKKLAEGIHKIGMFRIIESDSIKTDAEHISDEMHDRDALVVLVIPHDFTSFIESKADQIAEQALSDPDYPKSKKEEKPVLTDSVKMYYHPVMQPAFRQSIQGALGSVVQVIQGQSIVKKLYQNVNQKEIPADLEKQILLSQQPISETAVSRHGSRFVPNASQHNVPSWTIFAMFFIVISLGGSIVREKSSGSFIRLKTLPASYLYALLSKQIVYLAVTLLQATVIFAIGKFIFSYIGLPALNIPDDLIGLFFVTAACGYCAVSYAIMVGVFSKTPEQSNGFGVFSVLIMAALGGLLVPSFAMPAHLQSILRLSPLHWALEAYYGLFLEGGKLRDIWMNILSLVGIALIFQIVTLYRLKKKNLI